MSMTITTPTLNKANRRCRLAITVNRRDYWDGTNKRFKSGVVVAQITEASLAGTLADSLDTLKGWQQWYADFRRRCPCPTVTPAPRLNPDTPSGPRPGVGDRLSPKKYLADRGLLALG